jgi:hypothetical protein
MEKLYTAVVTAEGGRDGHITSADGIIDLEMKKPKALGGEDGYANPELLFAGAWGSCYLGALGSVGERDGVDVSGLLPKCILALTRRAKPPSPCLPNFMYTFRDSIKHKRSVWLMPPIRVAPIQKLPAVISMLK